jgi:hypothetical protein
VSSYNLTKPADRARYRKDHADELAATANGAWPRDINDALRWIHGSSPKYAAHMCLSAIEYIDDLEVRIEAGDPDVASFQPR